MLTDEHGYVKLTIADGDAFDPNLPTVRITEWVVTIQTTCGQPGATLRAFKVDHGRGVLDRHSADGMVFPNRDEAAKMAYCVGLLAHYYRPGR